jgi:hypothetical protein
MRQAREFISTRIHDQKAEFNVLDIIKSVLSYAFSSPYVLTLSNEGSIFMLDLFDTEVRVLYCFLFLRGAMQLAKIMSIIF